MGAVLSALGDAMARIYMGLFGRPLLQLQGDTDAIMQEIQHNTGHLADLVNSIPGVDWVTGLGSALNAVRHSVGTAQGLGDTFLQTAVRSGMVAFVWMLVGAVGMVALNEG